MFSITSQITTQGVSEKAEKLDISMSLMYSTELKNQSINKLRENYKTVFEREVEQDVELEFIMDGIMRDLDREQFEDTFKAVEFGEDPEMFA